MGKQPYHLQQQSVVSEGAYGPDKGHGKHGGAQKEENHRWSQEKTFQGPMFLSLYFCVNADAQDHQSYDLERGRDRRLSGVQVIQMVLDLKDLKDEGHQCRDHT